MPLLTTTPQTTDYAPLRAHAQHLVDASLLPGISWALLRGRELVDCQCVGWADREAGIALRTDHRFRIFSNTKLVTSICALRLLEEGRLQLDDPIARYLPALANLRVLRPDATALDDTEALRTPITIRHLLSHSAGFILGLFDNGTPLFEAYARLGVRNPNTTLAEMVEALGQLPLRFQPGTGWEYSMAIDVVARIIEIIEGERIDAVMSNRVFRPLDMTDTGFVVPPADAASLTAYYAGASDTDPLTPGLTRIDHEPYPGAYLKPVARLAGGGGLVSTLGDWVALIRSLQPGGLTLLRPETIALMMTNQLPAGQTIGFPNTGPLPGRGHGLAGACTLVSPPAGAADREGEFWWGGAAGTQWWINPSRGEAGVFMTQRRMAFWHPAYAGFRQASGSQHTTTHGGDPR